MIDNRNRFRYRFRHKVTGQESYFDTWCYGSIHEQISLYQKDLKQMCLQNVSNNTHELIEVIWLMNNATIWKED